MGHFTGQIKTRFCATCKRTTVHQEIAEKKMSATKIIGGLATGGWSLPFTGLKSEQMSYVCSGCGAVN